VPGMTRRGRVLGRLLDGGNDRSFSFDEVRYILIRLGFVERQRGSHHVFNHVAIPEILNLQARGSDAKPYQVRQVRRILLKYRLHLALVIDGKGGDDDE
jgi:predicted RNA binding protein YcfA (HicA-like mRNA interferase family)